MIYFVLFVNASICYNLLAVLALCCGVFLCYCKCLQIQCLIGHNAITAIIISSLCQWIHERGGFFLFARSGFNFCVCKLNGFEFWSTECEELLLLKVAFKLAIEVNHILSVGNIL